jgi:hypothetical protein
MIRRALLGLALTIATASVCSAQNSKPSAIDELGAFISLKESDYTEAIRAKFIQTFANYCQEVLNALPANTPAEDAWVVSQNNTAEKVQRLLSSKEYSRSFLKNAFSDCKNITTLLIQIQNIQEKEKGTEAFANLEAGQLIKLALNFNNGFAPYLPKVELNKDIKFGLSDLYVGIIRRELLIAAAKALQDVQK